MPCLERAIPTFPLVVDDGCINEKLLKSRGLAANYNELIVPFFLRSVCLWWLPRFLINKDDPFKFALA